MTTMRRTFVRGLVTLTPIMFLTVLAWWAYSLLSSLPVVAFVESPILRAGLLFLLFMNLVFSLGYLMRTAGGRVLDRTIHGLVNRFPLIRVIYNAVKRTLETVLTTSGSVLRPVKIEMWNDCRLAAFETGHRTTDGLAIVFIPGAPDITSGFVAEVDPDSLVETDDTLMEVLVRMLSCGFGDTKNHDP